MGREDIERLQQKIAKDPDSKLFVPLAEEYKKAGMIDDAINILIQGLGKQPNYLSARVSLGKMYMDAGLLNEAREEFLKVIAVIPDNLYAHKKLAEIYRELGQRAGAISELRIVLSLNPTDEWAISTLSAIEKEPEISEEQPREDIVEPPAYSAEIIESAVQEDPASSLEAAHGNKESAEDLIEKEGPQSPEDHGGEPSPFHEALIDADSAIQQGRYNEAWRDYKRILSENPGNRAILQRMAELKTLLKITGKDHEAHIMQLQRFLEAIKRRRDKYSGNR